ncbi:MAG: hypothetical protein JNM63_10840, partial [Spirochaetia bacterium]|nr:hypothetical protein [Spirochaetia bacterium]
ELGGLLDSHHRDWDAMRVDLKNVIEKKKKLLDECRSRLDSLRAQVDDPDFAFMQEHQEAIRDIYRRFSLPKDAAGIGLSNDELRFAVEHAVDVRPRLAIFDLHFAAGTIRDYA